VSSIFKWMIVLLLLIAVVGGAGAYWALSRSDELLRTEVLKQLEHLAPELTFDIERAHFDFTGRIRLHGMAIHLPGEQEPAFYTPEAVITLDDQSLTDFEKISIRRLRFVHPQWTVIRAVDGTWNWQGHRWQFAGGQAVPEIEIEHGTIQLALERASGSAVPLKLDDLNVSAVPSAARKWKAVLSTRIEPAGPLTVTANLNLDGVPASLEARWIKVPVNDDLLNLIGEFSPDVQTQLQSAREKLATLAAGQAAASPLPRSPPTDGGSPLHLQSRIPAVALPSPFGLNCQCDFRGRVTWVADGPPQFQLLTEIRGGQLSHMVLPVPLYEIRGTVYADPNLVILRDLKAQNGPTSLAVNARLERGRLPRVQLEIRKLPIDEPLKSRLPESARKLADSFALTGLCDVDASSVDTQGKLEWQGDLRLSAAALAHEKFEYPVQEVTGIARWRGNRIDLEGTGKSCGIPIQMAGWVVNPGPAHEARFLIRADRVPFNDEFRDACPAPLKRALVELDLQGTHDMRLQFHKPAGIGERYRMAGSAWLRDCSCRLKSFPYRIHTLQGRIDSNEERVTFRELQGIHDQTVLTGNGQFLREPGPGELRLSIHAENGAFDRSLEAALPPHLLQVWREFQPSGRFDVDAEVAWVPGQICQVQFPRIRVSDGEVILRSFPWPLRGIQGEFSYELLGGPSGESRLSIRSLSAQHDDTQLRGRGQALFSSREPWRVRFEELHVDDLIPNTTFRRALPRILQQAFDTLNPAGKFSIGTNGGIVELQGDGQNSVAANWNVQLLLTDCALTAGIRIDAIHGRVELKGSSDARTTSLTGQLDLDSLSVFRQTTGLAYQITRVTGPISLQDGIFVGGAPILASPSPPIRPPQLSERLSGDIFDGKATLDVVADLRQEPDYRMQVTLSRGRLETYARQYLRGQSNLAGVINSWLFLWGKGTAQDQLHGRGELQIAPAALYELPIFVQMFQVLRLDAVDRTAFDRADIRYQIENSRFQFDAIHLMGKAISLHGRGFVRFDGIMQLDFYSMLARRQIGIPVLQELTGALTRGWVGVKVTGSVGAPETRVVPVPEFDEAMKQFLGTFDPTLRSPAPRPSASRAEPSN